MSLTFVQVKRLIAIIRQHEVMFGGGISTSDAGFRDECELLIEEVQKLLPPEEYALIESNKIKVSGVRRNSNHKNATKRGLEEISPSIRIITESITPTSKEKSLKHETKAKPKKTEAHQNKKTNLIESKKNSQSTIENKKKVTKENTKIKEEKSSKKQEMVNDVVTPSKNVEHKHSNPIALAGKQSSGKSQLSPVELAKKSSSKNLQTKENTTNNTKRRIEAMHLFDAYTQNAMPKYGGYIVCVMFNDEEQYTIIEIVGYENLLDMYPSDNTLVFKTAGCKMYALVEKSNYSFKNVEPVHRANGFSIPYRFKELETFVTKKYQTIYVAKKPIIHPTSFNIIKPSGDNLAVLFYDVANVFENIQDFLINVIKAKNDIPTFDARKASEYIANNVKSFKLWLDQ